IQQDELRPDQLSVGVTAFTEQKLERAFPVANQVDAVGDVRALQCVDGQLGVLQPVFDKQNVRQSVARRGDRRGFTRRRVKVGQQLRHRNLPRRGQAVDARE